MELFYIPNITGDEVVLENVQFKHAIKALRKRQGDEILFTDGEGVLYEGKILNIEKRNATLGILSRREVVPSAYNVTVCVALTKNMKRIEWALEKITEMGIRRITPVICHRSERLTYNRVRLLKILVSAMKQSQQAFLPVLDDPMPFEELIHREFAAEWDSGMDSSLETGRGSGMDSSLKSGRGSGQVLRQISDQDSSANSDEKSSKTADRESLKSSDRGASLPADKELSRNEVSMGHSFKYIAYKSEASISLHDNYIPGSDVVVLIGPEGDFTKEELELAEKANFTALSLGHNRLRTETAAIVAVSGVHLMNG